MPTTSKIRDEGQYVEKRQLLGQMNAWRISLANLRQSVFVFIFPHRFMFSKQEGNIFLFMFVRLA
ncbi:hypothetical protein BSK33_16710 [Geobacillus sp. 44B]|nr:hypothetical protein BSK33_16710 [Geobacillus sp. 44B]